MKSITVRTEGKELTFDCTWLAATPEELQKQIDKGERKLAIIIQAAHRQEVQAAKNIARPIMRDGGSDESAIEATNRHNPDIPSTRIGATDEEKAENAARKLADKMALDLKMPTVAYNKLSKEARSNLIAACYDKIVARAAKATTKSE